ncbi:putative nuclease HARBI1 [Hordeum vulgare]|nr:putative nuclease HARBI1 [Hordeum vulgare]
MDGLASEMKAGPAAIRTGNDIFRHAAASSDVRRWIPGVRCDEVKTDGLHPWCFRQAAEAATGGDRRSGNDLLSIEVEDEENGEVNTSPNVAESSHPKGPPKKKAKVVKVLEDPLVTTLNYGFKLVADALVKSGDDDDIPAELWDEVCKLGEFDEEHLAHYYAHLVDNPKIAKAFMTLSQTNKSVWVSRYVKKNF